MSSYLKSTLSKLKPPIDDDLLYLVVHMYALSTGKPPVEKIFNPKSITGSGYNGYGDLLAYIRSLASEWGFGYTEAIRISAPKVGNTLYRDFLLRLSEAIGAGQDLERFLRVELDTLVSEFKAYYSRVLETIRVLLGLYTGLLSSVVFLNVNIMIIAYILWGNFYVAFYLMIVTALSTLALVAFIYAGLPKYRIVHSMEIRPESVRLLRISLLISMIFGTLTAATLYYVSGSLPLFIAVIGLSFYAPGYMAYKFESQVKRLSTFFPVFSKNYGALYATLGSEILALGSILRINLGPLNLILKKTRARLSNGLDRRTAWFLAAGESGSEIIRKGIDIIYDSIDTAADMRIVGEKLGNIIAEHMSMQKSREQLSRTFQSIAYLLQALLVAVAQFLSSLMIMFAGIVSKMGELPTPILPGLTHVELPPSDLYMLILILITSLASAIAIKSVEGGYMPVALLYLGILLIISAVSMWISKMASEIIIELFMKGFEIPVVPGVGG